MTEVTEVLYQWTKRVSQRQIVKLTGTSRNTARKIISRAIELGLKPDTTDDNQLLSVSAAITEWLKGNSKPAPGQAQQQLEAFHEQLKAWLDEPYMTIRQIGRLLAEQNPPAHVSETSLHRYIKKHFPKPIDSTVVLHTQPGEQAQVDFGYAGKLFDPALKKLRRTYAFVMTLSFSRHRFVRFVHKQDIATWIECHVEAFKFFGGVTQSVLLDNLKAGVLKPDIYDPLINRSYAECARYYGFIVDPAKVRTPKHKGKVERSIQIIRQQILAGREFDDLHQLNEYALHWCGHVIAHKVTRTTGETPAVRFERAEQKVLIALPEVPYELAIWQEAKVGRDQHITFQGSFYSLPIEYVGKRVSVRATKHMLTIHAQGRPIKVHQRLNKKGLWSTDFADIGERAKYYLEKTPKFCLDQAKAIGPGTHSVLSQILKHSSTTKLRKAQGILRLADQYSQGRLEEACLYALQFGDTTYDALKKIIVHDLDKTCQQTNNTMSFDELSDGAFLRNPHEFLTH